MMMALCEPGYGADGKLDSNLTGFLTEEEKKKLHGIFSKWLDHVEPDPLIEKMFKANLIKKTEYQRMKESGYDKARIIFDEMVLRSPYEDLSKIRRMLVETGIEDNIQIAKDFPHRGEEIDFTPPTNEEPEDYDVTQSAGLFRKKKTTSKKHERILSHYERRKGDKSLTGKGLCVVVRNFTKDLVGYSEDARSIRQFFEGVLNYEVLEGASADCKLLNLSYDEFESTLNTITAKLAKGEYDRFFLFVLSHGDEKGIILNAKGDGDHSDKDEERYSVDTMISKFDHLNLPSMKCFPKCFFIQACRGDIPAKSANSSSNQPPIPPEPHPESSITRAVGADILVCFPSQAGQLSWVPGTGSWFIQETIFVFRKYHESEHVVDMMVEVAKHSSLRMGTGWVDVKSPDGSQNTELQRVCQMPHIVCTLTKKLFLLEPPQCPHICMCK